ncbi:hypothetical protein L208DRAFT_1401446, partial [Tricholoma matsutake]
MNSKSFKKARKLSLDAFTIHRHRRSRYGMTVETPQAHLDHSEIDGFMSTGQNELNEYMWLSQIPDEEKHRDQDRHCADHRTDEHATRDAYRTSYMMLQLFPMVVVVLGCTEVGEEFVAGLVSLRCIWRKRDIIEDQTALVDLMTSVCSPYPNIG